MQVGEEGTSRKSLAVSARPKRNKRGDRTPSRPLPSPRNVTTTKSDGEKTHTFRLTDNAAGLFFFRFFFFPLPTLA